MQLTLQKMSRGRPHSDGTRAANFSGGVGRGMGDVGSGSGSSSNSWESAAPVVGDMGTSSPGSLGEGLGVAVEAV